MDPQLPTADVPLDAAVDVPLAAAVPEATEKEHTYKFEVQMSCGGCSGAVKRALDKAKENAESGISSFDVSLEKKEVIVKGAISYDDALATISKTGKTVLSGETIE